MTYADARLFTGGVYEKMGFTATGVGRPSYYWCKGRQRKHRANYAKWRLRQKGEKGLIAHFDESLSERQIMQAEGWWRVWDIGHVRYERT